MMGSSYRPPEHDAEANLPMFMQLTEAFKEIITSIIWNLNYPETDSTENCEMS